MAKKNKNQIFVDSKLDIPEEFVSQAGLSVKTHESIWTLAPSGKGNKTNIEWLQCFKDNGLLRDILLDTLINYAETRAASTVSTQRFALFAAFPDDNNCINEFKKRWNGLNESTKKTLSGFMTIAVTKLGHKHMEKYRRITSQFKYIRLFMGLHPTKGRLTDYEYDSILHNVRVLCDELPADPSEGWNFYGIRQSSKNNTTKKRFSHMKSVIAYRFMIQIARRPKQIAMLKWSDVLPVGTSFHDERIEAEPTYTGVKCLHIRCFKIKQSGNEYSFRYIPERWSIPLSQSFSLLLLKYRAVYHKGLSLQLKRLGVEEYKREASKLLFHCPIIPSFELFNADLTNTKTIDILTTENHSLFHVSEADIKGYVLVKSHRTLS